jgi:hypothetical protein
MYESFGLIGIQLPKKYKENFDVSRFLNVNQFDFSRAMPTLNLRTGMLGERDCAKPENIYAAGHRHCLVRKGNCS